jgi:hypothetical protein
MLRKTLYHSYKIKASINSSLGNKMASQTVVASFAKTFIKSSLSVLTDHTAYSFHGHTLYFLFIYGA